MPRVSCWDADEIRWINWHTLPNPPGFRPQLMPAKGVLKLIEKIEAGEILPVFIDSESEYPHKESCALFEAYLRCHVSMIPAIYKDKERVDADRDPVPPPIEDEEFPL